MDVVIFILTTLVLGVIMSIPGVMVGRLLASKGIVRARPKWIVGAGILGLFVARLMAPQAALRFLFALGIILVPLGMYRQDLWT